MLGLLVLRRCRGKKIHRKVTSDIHFSFIILDSRRSSTRIRQIQADMTHRAIELLNLPPDQPAFLLDIGCGSGLSGEILDGEGHVWAGMDIAPSMLGAWKTFYAKRECCLTDSFEEV